MSIIGDNIKYIRRLKNISQLELANYLGVKQPTVADWERSKSEPRRKRINSIAAALKVDTQMLESKTLIGKGLSTTDIINIEDDVNYAYIRAYDFSVSAGFGTMVDDETQHLFEEPFDYRWLRRITKTKADNLSLVFVDGDSMEPTLRSGDQVLVDHTQKGTKDGIYVLTLLGETYVKRLQFNHNKLMIISDNNLYPLREVNEQDENECHIHGRVIWFARKT